MDNELKKIVDLEKQILELKSTLEKERLKAEILNSIIEKANEQLGNDQKITTIVTIPEANPSKS